MDDVTVSLPHVPGALAAMGEALARAGISIEGGGAWVMNGLGVGHYLVTDGLAARRALEGAGLVVSGVRQVVAVRLHQAVPGQLGQLARRMADAGVNIETQYSDHDGQLILVPDDHDAAEQVAREWMRTRSAG